MNQPADPLRCDSAESRPESHSVRVGGILTLTAGVVDTVPSVRSRTAL